MTLLATGLELRASSVAAWVADVDGGPVLGTERVAGTGAAACRAALAAVVDRAGPGERAGLVVSWTTGAADLLQELTGSPLARPGAVVGELLDGWPLPATLPVVAGGDLDVVTALGAGGLASGVVTLLLGPPPRLVALTDEAPDGWSRVAAGVREAVTLGPADLDAAAGALRGAAAVVVVGDTDDGSAQALAALLGRPVHVEDRDLPAAVVGGTHLVARAVGAHTHAPVLPGRVVTTSAD